VVVNISALPIGTLVSRASGGITLSKSRTRNEETPPIFYAEAAARDGDDEDGED
jgi:hypothetical protein